MTPAGVVVYDQVQDDGVAGAPGLETFTDASRTSRLQRAGDNNGAHNYRIDCVYGFNNTVYIVGERSAQGRFTPNVWTSNAGSFLTQTPGI